MSRVLIKNVHSNSIDDLKQALSKHGEVTDFKFKSKKDKTSLGYAFAGFKDADSAQKAIKIMNGSKFSNQKILVEEAVSLFDPQRPKSSTNKAFRNKVYAEKVTKAEDFLENRKSKEEYLVEMLADVINDESFIAFLKVKSAKHSIPLTKRLEDLKQDAKKYQKARHQEFEERVSNLKEVLAKKEQKNAEGEKFMIKFKAPRNINKQHIVQFFSPVKIVKVDIPWHGKQVNPGFVDIELANEADQQRAMSKNNRFLLKKKISLMPYKIEASSGSDQTHQKELTYEKKTSDAISSEIFENGQLFFRNLPYTCTEEELNELLTQFGPLTELKFPVILQKDGTSVNKGYGSCSFTFPEHAIKAFKELDGSCFQGRILHILPGTQRSADNIEADDSLILERTKNTTEKDFKAIKDKNLKQNAQKSFNWNTFFFTPDAITNILAKKYNISKEQILNPSKSDISVTLALGEAQIVNETKIFLEQHGIFLDAFSSSEFVRSVKVILMKNLPVEMEVPEIQNQFNINQLTCEIIRPVNSSSCLLKFYEKSEAKRFFERFSYFKLKSGPIFLEWAPTDIFKQAKNLPKQNKKQPIQDTSSSLLVKNVPQQATQDEIMDIFKACNPLKVDLVQDKKTHKTLSSCCVYFNSAVDAQNALKSLQGSTLHGNKLNLSQSKIDASTVSKKRTGPSQVQSASQDEASTKIIVKNLPFQATKYEIKQLFASFGEIDYVRMPTKAYNYSNYSSQTHRGFCFVNFTLAHEAKKAFEMLSLSTHLYGRRLILQWASDNANNQQQELVSAQKKAKLNEIKSAEEIKSGLERDLDY